MLRRREFDPTIRFLLQRPAFFFLRFLYGAYALRTAPIFVFRSTVRCVPRVFFARAACWRVLATIHFLHAEYLNGTIIISVSHSHEATAFLVPNVSQQTRVLRVHEMEFDLNVSLHWNMPKVFFLSFFLSSFHLGTG
jgi:hypothetical protein